MSCALNIPCYFNFTFLFLFNGSFPSRWRRQQQADTPEESTWLSGSSRGLAPGHSQASSATSIGEAAAGRPGARRDSGQEEPSLRQYPPRSDIYKQFCADRKADILRTASPKTMASYVDNSFRQAVMMNPAERTQQVGRKKKQQLQLIACISFVDNGSRFRAAFVARIPLRLCVTPPHPPTQPRRCNMLAVCSRVQLLPFSVLQLSTAR